MPLRGLAVPTNIECVLPYKDLNTAVSFYDPDLYFMVEWICCCHINPSI